MKEELKIVGVTSEQKKYLNTTHIVYHAFETRFILFYMRTITCLKVEKA